MKPEISVFDFGDDSLAPVAADALHEISAQTGAAMALKIDDIIRAAISRRLGRDDWTLEDMRGRLNKVVYLPTKREVYSVDWLPLVEFFPMRFSIDGSFLNASINYVDHTLLPEGDQKGASKSC